MSIFLIHDNISITVMALRGSLASELPPLGLIPTELLAYFHVSQSFILFPFDFSGEVDLVLGQG